MRNGALNSAEIDEHRRQQLKYQIYKCANCVCEPCICVIETLIITHVRSYSIIIVIFFLLLLIYVNIYYVDRDS